MDSVCSVVKWGWRDPCLQLGARRGISWRPDEDDALHLTLVVLAAGLSTRYGRLKQLEPVGPSGETLLDYGLFDAWRAGFERVVLVVRPEIDATVREHIARRWRSRQVDFVHQQLSDRKSVV